MTDSSPIPSQIGRKDLDDAVWVAREALRPLPQPEAAMHLRGLFELYGLPEFDSDAASKLFYRAWYEDLAEWPADLVVEACKRWRRSPAKTRPKTSGHLMDVVRDEMLKRRAFERNVREARKRMAEHDKWMSEHVCAPVGSEEHKAISAGLRNLAKSLRMGAPVRPISPERAKENFEQLRKSAGEEGQ